MLMWHPFPSCTSARSCHSFYLSADYLILFFRCAFACRHHRIYTPRNQPLTTLFDSVALSRSSHTSLDRWFVAKHFSVWIISQVDGNRVAVWQYLLGEVRHLELWSFDVGNRNTGLDTISRHCCSRCHAKGKQTSFASSAHTLPNARFGNVLMPAVIRSLLLTSPTLTFFYCVCVLPLLFCSEAGLGWRLTMTAPEWLATAHFLKYAHTLDNLIMAEIFWFHHTHTHTHKFRDSFPAHVWCLSYDWRKQKKKWKWKRKHRRKKWYRVWWFSVRVWRHS